MYIEFIPQMSYKTAMNFSARVYRTHRPALDQAIPTNDRSNEIHYIPSTSFDIRITGDSVWPLALVIFRRDKNLFIKKQSVIATDGTRQFQYGTRQQYSVLVTEGTRQQGSILVTDGTSRFQYEAVLVTDGTSKLQYEEALISTNNRGYEAARIGSSNEWYEAVQVRSSYISINVIYFTSFKAVLQKSYLAAILAYQHVGIEGMRKILPI